MSTTAPHYLLFSETQSDDSSLAGGWSFVLERTDRTGRIEVTDQEPEVRGERLKLLSVVRGLEALEHPSRVTLITPCRFIGRGIRTGMTAWKENAWQWERFGAMTEVKNADLWKRIDRARSIHTVDCRVWNFGNALQHLGPSLSTCRSFTGNPVVKSYKERGVRSLNIPSWTELAAMVANRIIPLSKQRAYSCA